MRRRRLDAFRNAPPWPGKDPALAREEAQYDHCLIVAAQILEVPTPDDRPSPGRPLPPEVRCVLEDRLAAAGLDVFAPRRGVTGDILDDDDLVI
jgi:hypothetical protein